jgi:hypothetical protein
MLCCCIITQVWYVQAYQRRCIDCVKRLGATVVVTRHSCVTYDEAAALIKESLTLGPVGGIFNLALVSQGH